MRPTGYVPRMWATGDSGVLPIGPAMTTLRSVIAYLALMIRCAGIAYVVVQVVIWHSFYAASRGAWAVPPWPWRGRRGGGLPAEALAFPAFACVDSAVYVALALGAQGCVPPAVRDNAFSWLVISMSGQLIVPAWYAPGAALRAAGADFAAGLLDRRGAAASHGHKDSDGSGGSCCSSSGSCTDTVAGYSTAARPRRTPTWTEADQAAREQYAILCRNIERREHERLVHDTVLNTLTALARAGGRCRGRGGDQVPAGRGPDRGRARRRR